MSRTNLLILLLFVFPPLLFSDNGKKIPDEMQSVDSSREPMTVAKLDREMALAQEKVRQKMTEWEVSQMKLEKELYGLHHSEDVQMYPDEPEEGKPALLDSEIPEVQTGLYTQDSSDFSEPEDVAGQPVDLDELFEKSLPPEIDTELPVSESDLVAVSNSPVSEISSTTVTSSPGTELKSVLPEKLPPPESENIKKTILTENPNDSDTLSRWQAEDQKLSTKKI